MKINKDDFIHLKDKVKFLEYYWHQTEILGIAPNAYKSEVIYFMEHNLYEKLTKVKLSLLKSHYIIDNKQYEKLTHYANISSLLEDILNE